jgi:Na+-transporting NADH:ubiquinone oxidoreductase subunit C
VSVNRSFSNKDTLLFMLVLSFACAFILSVLASSLQVPKEEAKELDRSRQMLLSTRIYNAVGDYFQLKEGNSYIPAKCLDSGKLGPGTTNDHPSTAEILAVYHARIRPVLIDSQGNVTTFAKAGINEEEYVAKNKKKGYAQLPLKLAYEILSNSGQEVEGYVIPISGFGLWDAIYGYIAIAPDGNTVIGISWYEQKETPGLGANIAEADWQSQFPDKKIFQADSSGKIDVHKSSLGLTVVRGKVKEVIGDNPKSWSAVDGMSGATLTGNGVSKAYKDSLEPYRPFLIRLYENSSKEKK